MTATRQITNGAVARAARREGHRRRTPLRNTAAQGERPDLGAAPARAVPATRVSPPRSLDIDRTDATFGTLVSRPLLWRADISVSKG